MSEAETQPQTQPQRLHSRALPLWAKGSVALGIILALAAAFLTRTLAQQGAWSDGVLASALTAALLALLTLLVVGGRALLGYRTRRARGQAGLLVLVLLAVAVGGFVAAPSLRVTQARNAMQRGQWQEAIEEYAHGGESPPNAPGIAGAYVAWGEQMLAQKNYTTAAARLSTVTTRYAASGHIVTQARHDLYRTYSEWMRADARHVMYGGPGGALATFQQYQSDPACDTTCRTQIATALPLAHFQYGEQLIATQDYTGAITQFETVTAQYGASPYASQARAAAAQAYYGWGRQQIAGQTCGDAVATYRTLVARYPDTPEATLAKTALVAPQPVSGTLSGMPTNPAPVVALSQKVNISGYVFSADYTVTPDASGAFTLPHVAQGAYNLSTKRDVNNAVSYTYYHDAKGNVYTVHVGPLCPVQLGVIAYSAKS